MFVRNKAIIKISFYYIVYSFIVKLAVVSLLFKKNQTLI